MFSAHYANRIVVHINVMNMIVIDDSKIRLPRTATFAFVVKSQIEFTLGEGRKDPASFDLIGVRAASGPQLSG